MPIKILVMILTIIVIPQYSIQIKWQTLPDIPVYDVSGKALENHQLQIIIPTTIKKFGQICFHQATFQAPKYRVLNLSTNCSTYFHTIGLGKVTLFQETCGYFRETKLAATVCIDEPKAPTQLMVIAGNQYLLCFEDSIVTDESGPRHCDHELHPLASILEINGMKMNPFGLAAPVASNELGNWNLELGDSSIIHPSSADDYANFGMPSTTVTRTPADFTNEPAVTLTPTDLTNVPAVTRTPTVTNESTDTTMGTSSNLTTSTPNPLSVLEQVDSVDEDEPMVTNGPYNDSEQPSNPLIFIIGFLLIGVMLNCLCTIDNVTRLYRLVTSRHNTSSSNQLDIESLPSTEISNIYSTIPQSYVVNIPAIFDHVD